MPTAIIEHADGLPLPQRNWAISTIALALQLPFCFEVGSLSGSLVSSAPE